jgi:MraZ protein
LAFRGHFEHSLDAKNRLSIPARFRAAFSSGTVLAKDFEPCVAVWTADAHETIVERALGALNPLSKDYRDLSRYFQGNSFDTELDASGRVILPAPLLEHLVELAPETLVGVLAVDARSRRRLEAIVQQYSSAAVLGALLDDQEAAAGLVEAADLILVTNAARLPGHLAARARRVVRVGWTLEPGGLGGWRAQAGSSRETG